MTAISSLLKGAAALRISPGLSTLVPEFFSAEVGGREVIIWTVASSPVCGRGGREVIIGEESPEASGITSLPVGMGREFLSPSPELLPSLPALGEGSGLEPSWEYGSRTASSSRLEA